MKEDIEASQADLEDVHEIGEQLMTMCGESERPEVQKNIDDLDNNMSSIADDFEKRSKNLEEALAKAITFQDDLMVKILSNKRLRKGLAEHATKILIKTFAISGFI